MSDNKPSLKHFLLKHLNDPAYREQLQWVDHEQCTFRVLWMHAGRATFDRDRHQKLFYNYREYRGHKTSEDPKQCFGMALKKSPYVKPIENAMDDDWRHFKFINRGSRSPMTALQKSNARRTSALSLGACASNTAHAPCTATQHTLPCMPANAPQLSRSATLSLLPTPSNLSLPPSPSDLTPYHNPPCTPLPHGHPQDQRPLPEDLVDLDFESLWQGYSRSPQPASTRQPWFTGDVPTSPYPPTPSGSASPFSPYSLSASPLHASSPFPHSPAEFSPEPSTTHWVS